MRWSDRAVQILSSQQSINVWASLLRTSMTGSSARPGRTGLMCDENRSDPPNWVMRATFSTADARTSASWSWRRPAKAAKASTWWLSNLLSDPKPMEPATVANSLDKLCRTRQLKSHDAVLTTGKTISDVSSGSIPRAQPTLPLHAHASSLTESCSSLLRLWNSGTISSTTILRTSFPPGPPTASRQTCGSGYSSDASFGRFATASTNLPRCFPAPLRTMGASSSHRSRYRFRSSRRASSSLG
mmetsp:Transcript_36585/g.67689  ORF Transcript_36585/g.67689 Transcript_36585/m.67689 type:complete len:243 (-) Transcript_36585:1039-1767(-)